MKRPNLNDLSGQVFDLLIIGGGITGAATARDAALRGLSVALLEKQDFASGTSSRSTKLIHGGLRYLERFNFKLVREACRERELMARLAPHLWNPRPFIYTLYQGYPESPFKLNAGLTIYDWFSGNPRERRHKMLNRKEVLAIEPHLNPDGLKGGGIFYDSLTDDARLTIETLKSAVDSGAVAANYMQVTDFVYDKGRISGVHAVDCLTGETGTVRARQVINAAGPWVDQVRALEQGEQKRRLRPTKGVHIVLHKSDFPVEHAIFLRSPRDNRVVWPIPALNGDLVYVGTTDTDYNGSLNHVVATKDDIDYLLEVANFAVPGKNLGYDHVVGTWAGLRPLIKPEGDLSTSATSREHEIFVSSAGLLNVAGGKLTTARIMGAQVVQKALELLNREFGLKGAPESTSSQHPLSGGDIDNSFRQKVDDIRDRLGLDPVVTERLARHYGSNFFRIADIVSHDSATAESLGGHGVIDAEVRYAVEVEMARTVTDFLTRRASLFYWTKDGAFDIAPAVATRMASLLGYSAAEQERQINDYRRWVEANRNFSTESVGV